MKCKTLLACIGAVVACAGVAAIAPVGGGDFAVTNFTIDGGGGTSSGGAFVVSGTIGQFDAGPGSTGRDCAGSQFGESGYCLSAPEVAH